ncbi:MAG: hypothetical protein MUF42_12830 [Cytophagaceae bacterium]|nr:hypothetical protein [Cytophagaceae bacterium]
MKYLSLEKDELKELIFLRLGSFSISLFILALSCFTIGLILHQFVHSSILFAGIPILFFMTGLSVLIYSQRPYLKDLTKKEKKVYKGILARKKEISKNKKIMYTFNVDGYIFHVEEEHYRQYKEGDFLEFHISPGIKHLFRVDKVA